MGIKMTVINPEHSDGSTGKSTYQYGMDDGCLVVASGDLPNDNKVYLNPDMINWIEKNGMNVLKKHHEDMGLSEIVY